MRELIGLLRVVRDFRILALAQVRLHKRILR